MPHSETVGTVLPTQHVPATIEYKPLILDPRRAADAARLSALLHDACVAVFDTLTAQLGELIKIRHPNQRWSGPALDAAIQAHVGSCDQADYGVWVYYPWSGRLVHTLPAAEFIEVRTNRNVYKITPEEQRQLANKRIGIIGLSVGQAIAFTLAMERSCGAVYLADFDLLELSNLNRVRTGIHQLGLPKVIAAAREIAELDPFLRVTCFPEGVTEDTIESFLTADGGLDLLIDECDSLDIKILARTKARQLHIPVLMHTSDRGMVDVERFDRTPQRPILHGLIDHLGTTRLTNLTSEEKIPYILAMLGIDTISQRLKASMLEVEQTIPTWPQLASAVTLGSAIVGDIARRILLDHYHDSGRYFVDLDTVIADHRADTPPLAEPAFSEARRALTREEMRAIAVQHVKPSLQLDRDRLLGLVEAATLAPSGGNMQPWQWLYHGGSLYLFHDPSRSSFFDLGDTAAYLALGAAAENLILAAHTLGLEVSLQRQALRHERLAAVFSFAERAHALIGAESHRYDPLAACIRLRATNRTLGPRQPISAEMLQQLQQISHSIAGAQVTFLTSDAALAACADIAAAMERLRLFHQQGHHDFVHEVRWSREEAEAARDGIDLATIDLTHAERAGLQVAKAWPVVAQVAQWGGGAAFEKLTRKAIESASSVGFLTMPHGSLHDFFAGGRALQLIWLAATQHQLAFQPLAATTFLFARLLQAQLAGFDAHAVRELAQLREQFVRLFPIVETQQGELLLFRLASAAAPAVTALRYPVEMVLTIDDGA